MPWIATRPATLEDLDRVRAVLVETWHATYDTTLGAARVTEITDRWHAIDALAKQCAVGGGALMVALWDGRIVATASATRTNDETVMLQRLYVRPAYQGLGIGDRLLRATLAHFPDCSMVSLEVEPHNTDAIQFYVARGFRKRGETANCGGDPATLAAHIYARALPL
jgi:ribosomal protein S18 acetylase RimI-like enzyme